MSILERSAGLLTPPAHQKLCREEQQDGLHMQAARGMQTRWMGSQGGVCESPQKAFHRG